MSRTTVLHAIAVTLALAPAPAAGGPAGLSVTIAAAESGPDGCRLTLALASTLPAPVASLGLDAVLIGADGQVIRLAALALGALEAGTVARRAVTLPAIACADLETILIHGPARCTAQPAPATPCPGGLVLAGGAGLRLVR